MWKVKKSLPKNSSPLFNSSEQQQQNPDMTFITFHNSWLVLIFIMASDIELCSTIYHKINYFAIPSIQQISPGSSGYCSSVDNYCLRIRVGSAEVVRRTNQSLLAHWANEFVLPRSFPWHKKPIMTFGAWCVVFVVLVKKWNKPDKSCWPSWDGLATAPKSDSSHLKHWWKMIFLLVPGFLPNATVDGRNPANQLRLVDLVVSPMIYKVFAHHPNGGWPWDFCTINSMFTIWAV